MPPSLPREVDRAAKATYSLASGNDLTKALFQSVENYPQWKDQIATPAFAAVDALV
ncbi:MAG TPA: hypothetical protein VFI00_19000 [Kribbella sp.]|nr:hypothetical protein [Kribbella sp.]